MELSEKLQELRKEKGLTQEELAEALFVSRTAISKWESGRGVPNIESLKAISKFFSVSIDELLSGEEILKIADELLPTSSDEFDAVFENGNDFEAPSVYQSYVEAKMQVSKPMFNIGIKDTSIPENAAERQKRDAIYSILDEMIFSRAGELYSSLFEREIISPHLSYGYTVSPTSAYNSIAGEADDPQLVLNEILAHVELLKKNGLSYEDFLRGKRVMYAEFVKSFDSTDNVANNMLSFIFDGGELLSYADIIDSVTFNDVKTAFEHAFDKEKITLSVVLPLKSEKNKEEI